MGQIVGREEYELVIGNLVYNFHNYFALPLIIIFTLFHISGKLLFFLYPYDDDSNRTIEEIISARGFICENHSVTTIDGYILTLQRIVHPENIFSRKYKLESDNPHVANFTKKPPVLLQHGMFSNSRSWLIASDDGYLGIDVNRNFEGIDQHGRVDNSLAFSLSKAGYDVFLGNARGTLYSLGHERLNYQKDNEFWSSSMSELVMYDLPATIDYVLKLTGFETLAYVGFSQGTSSMFALLTQEEKYNNIVKPIIFMAPVGNPHHTNPLNFPEEFKQRVFRSIASWCHLHPGPVLPLMSETVMRYFCSNFYFRKLLNKLCFTTSILSNFPDPERSLVYIVTTSSHCMRRNLAHILQNIENKNFCDYDYGSETNRKKYGSKEPPEYDLKRITNQYICFFYSMGDIISRYEDVLNLKKKLKGEIHIIRSQSLFITVVPLMYEYEIPGYNHLDFQLGQCLGSKVNNKIVAILDSTTKKNQLDCNDNHATKLCGIGEER